MGVEIGGAGIGRGDANSQVVVGERMAPLPRIFNEPVHLATKPSIPNSQVKVAIPIHIPPG